MDPNFTPDLAAENEKLRRQLTELQAAYQRQKRFETIFNDSQVAHKVINSDLKILEINQAVSALLGYAPEEILGTVIMDYTHPDFKPHWQTLQHALWQRKIPVFDLETCLIRKDGSQVWCMIHTFLFENMGETFGCTLLEDITGRKQLERHKDDFISTVSHELKTPMTSLKSQSQLLHRRLKQKGDEQSGRLISGMEKQINRLTRLIHNLVLVSKIESGHLQPTVQDYDIAELVRELADEFQLTMPDRQIDLDLPDTLMVKGDRDKVHQVLYNLMTNAVTFSAKGARIDLCLQQKDNRAVVCIQDYGRGIPKEDLQLIFERFYKVKTPTSMVEAGMGLGLYISADIIRYQEGELWVESTPGKGSKFCFNLPLSNL
ncbi:sensor histidine kinase [Mucilaginibacter lacusdianchii]|uniref:sensor histidine kinase n=1 Tax=Mucilaginibacter lacusdianchii TaxID=2684211 RepID=UPI00131B357E|nr:PAS domain-containing sensor histidine kinase [Mucilaginibacter sp. JXJ CY 39]